MPIEITQTGTYDTLREVAHARGVAPRTVKFWIDRDGLPAIEIPSESGLRAVTFLIRRDDWQCFTPPAPGVKARPVEERDVA